MRDKLISLRRAINNGWYDDEKQGAINLFLGHFQPRLGQSDLWDLDSDHYLHSGVQHSATLDSNKDWGSYGSVPGFSRHGLRTACPLSVANVE